jgi:formylmethanofuran:tetrahydromethanopterin formyltransferase
MIACQQGLFKSPTSASKFSSDVTLPLPVVDAHAHDASRIMIKASNEGYFPNGSITQTSTPCAAEVKVQASKYRASQGGADGYAGCFVTDENSSNDRARVELCDRVAQKILPIKPKTQVGPKVTSAAITHKNSHFTSRATSRL